MELPSIPEQLVEAERLCTDARRLVNELRDLAATARKRWEIMSLHNSGRWGVPMSVNRRGRWPKSV